MKLRAITIGVLLTIPGVEACSNTDMQTAYANCGIEAGNPPPVDKVKICSAACKTSITTCPDLNFDQLPDFQACSMTPGATNVLKGSLTMKVTDATSAVADPKFNVSVAEGIAEAGGLDVSYFQVVLSVLTSQTVKADYTINVPSNSATPVLTAKTLLTNADKQRLQTKIQYYVTAAQITQTLEVTEKSAVSMEDTTGGTSGGTDTTTGVTTGSTNTVNGAEMTKPLSVAGVLLLPIIYWMQ